MENMHSKILDDIGKKWAQINESPVRDEIQTKNHETYRT